MGFDLDASIDITGIVLLFCLVFGMSATVDIGCLYAQLQNRKAIGTGILLQFLVLPFIGFTVVKTLNLNHAMGITLLVVTSSPGGSYSNWYEPSFG
jgi:predicted Na+-dependent transporter